MPAYNEEATILEIVGQVMASPYTAEVLVVDDCSSDRTADLVRTITDPRLRLLSQLTNQGKGAALRRGFAEASQQFVIVQDADLEYNPGDYEQMMAPLLRGAADVVFGSRFMGGHGHRVLYYWHSLGNKVLTTFSNLMTNLNLTDMETCYKLFSKEIMQQIAPHLQQERFGIEPELTARVSSIPCRIFEMSISYHGRTYDEGKKIGMKDGFSALWCIVKYGTQSILARRRAKKARLLASR